MFNDRNYLIWYAKTLPTKMLGRVSVRMG